MEYPLMNISEKEFDKLPKGEEFVEGDLKFVPIGFKFVCRGSTNIIGHVVKGLDLIANQWGAGLSIPERGVNRYKANIIVPNFQI